MHHSGWILLAICAGIGIISSGFSLGPVLGALLVASLMLHEAGHILMAKFLKVPVKEFGICSIGMYIRRACSGRRRDEILIAFSGPLMNLLLAPLMLLIPHIGTSAALCNLSLFVFNLLPISSSDGTRILRNILDSSGAAAGLPALNTPTSR